MPIYRIDYIQTVKRNCYVEADSCMEAREKFEYYDDVFDDNVTYSIEDKIEDVYLDE